MDAREASSVWEVGFGIDGRRACGSVASADIVGAYDKEAVGVDGFAWADEIFPPASLAILIPSFTDTGDFWVEACRVLRAS